MRALLEPVEDVLEVSWQRLFLPQLVLVTGITFPSRWDSKPAWRASTTLIPSLARELWQSMSWWLCGLSSIFYMSITPLLNHSMDKEPAPAAGRPQSCSSLGGTGS